MSGAEPRVVVVGSLNIDMITTAERLPAEGETVIGIDYQTGFGGKGANQAVMAARLGAAVTLVGAVGEDDLGTAYLANLGREGIATAHVTRVSGSSGVAPIWVDATGSNRIIVVPGANDHVPAESAVRAIRTGRPAVVVGQFEIPQAVTAAGFDAARSSGAVTILNPAPAVAIAPDLLAVTDWLVPNETEFALLAGVPLAGDAGADLAAIRAYGRTAGVSVVVTLGVRGAALVPLDAPATIVPTVAVTAIDTTGAGDAFVGAFAVGLALGWAPVAAARLGCAAAADSVTRVGTQRSYADRGSAGRVLAAVKSSAGEGSR